MVEPCPKTDIHLVYDFPAALHVAEVLGIGAIALDMEGLIGNYVGNRPYDGNLQDFLHGNGETNMAHAQAFILDHPDIAFGIVTNHTNHPGDEANAEGLVTRVARTLEIPFVHKGMRAGGVVLRAKPSGDLTRHFCEVVDVPLEHTVLIDD